jgi:hypothetical protein
VSVLAPHLRKEGVTSFVEPCAGASVLANQLMDQGLECFGQYDIAPDSPDVVKCDAFYLRGSAHPLITNPPWSRGILHPLIEHLRSMNDTWLLFDAPWAFTDQAAPYLPYCSKIIAVGRLKWFPGTDHVHTKDVAWYRFGRHETQTEFIGRES